MAAVAVCPAVDFAVFGEDAERCAPDEKVAVFCDLEVHYVPPDERDGAISLTIIDGLPGDRRVMVNSDVLRWALEEAGVPWVKASA